MSREPDITKEVEERETGYEMRISSTRGTGTRDQDTVKLTLRTETLGQLVTDMRGAENAVTETMNKRREHKPDESEDQE